MKRNWWDFSLGHLSSFQVVPRPAAAVATTDPYRVISLYILKKLEARVWSLAPAFSCASYSAPEFLFLPSKLPEGGWSGGEDRQRSNSGRRLVQLSRRAAAVKRDRANTRHGYARGLPGGRSREWENRARTAAPAIYWPDDGQYFMSRVVDYDRDA